MKTVLIAGGTGLVGKQLSALLVEQGFSVIVLTRSIPVQAKQAIDRFAQWDTNNRTIDRWAIEASDFIVNLSGAGVAEKRWTPARKKEIVESREKSGATIIKALTEIPNKVEAVINASAIGWYGPDEEGSNSRPFVETDPYHLDFLGETCYKWEQSIEPVRALGKRLVCCRIGIVLSNKGGALKEFKKPLQMGLATILGSGKQMVSWIHIEDLCRIFLKAITDSHMEGVYNTVAPTPVSNRELTLTLAKTNKNFYIPFKVPAFVLKLVLGEMSVEVLKSATVSSSKISNAGFQFKHNTIKEALQHLQQNPMF